MARVPWKRLASDLRDDEAGDAYHASLRRRLTNVEEGQRQLERELVEEMAGALGRSEAKVKQAVAELAAFEAGLDARTAAGEHVDAVALERHRALRTVALAKRRDLLIHREAIGMPPREELLAELYPIGPPRR